MNFALDSKFTVKPGRSNTGLAPNAQGASGAKKVATPSPIGPPPQNGERRALIAWDPSTQTERWRANEGGSIGGGTVTTAGNLVFQSTPDGKLIAYSADQGTKLLEIKTGLGGGMGPPITYELDGKQYVTLMGGIGKVVPRYQDAPGGVPPTPGPTAAQTGTNATPDLATTPAAAPTVAPKLMTFVLDGQPI